MTFWTLQNDSTNVAILIIDYQTYEFEGGNLTFYPPCEDCDIDSIPFEVLFDEIPDFYDIAFTYTETGDTLFYATIIWMGLGQILYPEVFFPSDRFKTIQSDIPDPIGIEYFDFEKIEDSLAVKGNMAWEVVKNLDITKDFSRNPYRVGAYLYPPTLGVFNPNPAKWIIFLYRGKVE